MRRIELVDLELSLHDLELLIKLTAEASAGYLEGLSINEQDHAMILHQSLEEAKEGLDEEPK